MTLWLHLLETNQFNYTIFVNVFDIDLNDINIRTKLKQHEWLIKASVGKR